MQLKLSAVLATLQLKRWTLKRSKLREGKVLPVHDVRHTGGVEVQIRAFVSLSRDGSGVLHPERCSTGARPAGSHCKGGWAESTVGLGVFEEEEISSRTTATYLLAQPAAYSQYRTCQPCSLEKLTVRRLTTHIWVVPHR